MKIVSDYRIICFVIFKDISFANNALMEYNKNFNKYKNRDINNKYFITFSKECTRKF